MDKFLETYDQPKLTQKETDNQNRPTMWIDWISNQWPPTKKSPAPDGFICEFYQLFKEELIPMLHKLFQKIERAESLPKSIYEASITPIPKPDKDTTEKRKLETTILYEYWC